MKAIIGLGNPGKNYEQTKHNIGFMAVDTFAKKHGTVLKKKKHEALCGEFFIGQEKIILVQPLTYMNASGRAVYNILEYYELEQKDLLVIYDDIDLDFGVLRLRKKGSAGTHNGMRDIVSAIQSTEFSRLRIGIGRDPRKDLISEVLSRFAPEERKHLPILLEYVAEAIDSFICDGIDLAMSRYNGRFDE